MRRSFHQARAALGRFAYHPRIPPLFQSLLASKFDSNQENRQICVPANVRRRKTSSPMSAEQRKINECSKHCPHCTEWSRFPARLAETQNQSSQARTCATMVRACRSADAPATRRFVATRQKPQRRNRRGDARRDGPKLRGKINQKTSTLRRAGLYGHTASPYRWACITIESRG